MSDECRVGQCCGCEESHVRGRPVRFSTSLAHRRERREPFSRLGVRMACCARLGGQECARTAIRGTQTLKRRGLRAGGTPSTYCPASDNVSHPQWAGQYSKSCMKLGNREQRHRLPRQQLPLPPCTNLSYKLYVVAPVLHSQACVPKPLERYLICPESVLHLFVRLLIAVKISARSNRSQIHAGIGSVEMLRFAQHDNRLEFAQNGGRFAPCYSGLSGVFDPAEHRDPRPP